MWIGGERDTPFRRECTRRFNPCQSAYPRQHPRKIVEAATTQEGTEGDDYDGSSVGRQVFWCLLCEGELDKQRDVENGAGRTRIITVAHTAPNSRRRERRRPTDWLRSCHYERIDVLTLRRHSVFLTCCLERFPPESRETGETAVVSGGGGAPPMRFLNDCMIGNFLS